MPRQRHTVTTFTFFIPLALLIFLSGCGAGSNPIPDLDKVAASGFTLDVLAETFLDEMPAGDFSVEITETGETLQAAIAVSDAAGLKACYFRLWYDAEHLEPLTVTAGDVLVPAEAENRQDVSLLTLAVVNEPGVIHHGQILVHPDEQDGFSGDGVLATVEFALAPFVARVVSQPPITDASQTEANWDPISQTLSWRYACQGDYNQDGYVTINDLTPLGRNFQLLGPFPAETALSQVDGNDDGEINIADLTPIGQNFGRFVEGYEVYASFNPADIPADNANPPLLPPMDFVPFSSHQGNPSVDRLMFAAEYPDLDPGSILWVRPASEEQSGTPSTQRAALPYDWTISCPSNYSSLEASTGHVSLARVSGIPAVLYIDNQQQQLVFQRALDAKGIVWGDEVVVAESQNTHFASSMIDVHGQAAVGHHEADTGEVKYLRAADLAGSSWSEPVVIDTTTSGGWDCHLLMVDFHPAVIYANLADASLMYCRALDPLGEDWGMPVVIAELGSSEAVLGSWSSPAVIADHPAAAFYHPGTQELRFVRASDVLGNSWDSPVSVVSGNNVGRYCSLAMIHDAPGISYLGDHGLAYVLAHDPQGGTWWPPMEIDSSRGTVDHLDTSLALIDGHPAISYYSGQPPADLLFVRAIDGLGALWEVPQTIDSANYVGRSSCLLDQDGMPAIAYLDESARQVMYAYSGSPGPILPVARLSAYPAQAAVDEVITFDASLSYALQGELVTFEWDLDGDDSFETGTGDVPMVEHSFSEARTHFIGVRVTDSEGLSQIVYEYVVVGTPGTRPTAVLQADLLDVAQGQSIQFDAGDSWDDDWTIIEYEWDLEGDGDFELNMGAVSDLNYEYSVIGVYNPAVRVWNDVGLWDIASVCINVGMLNIRPVAEVTATPLTGNPPFEVNFDASASHDPDGTIVSYEWDLDNDGLFEYQGGTTASLAWLCERHGDQRIRMRVTDNLQAKTTTWLMIGANQAPVPVLTANKYSGTAPYTITLDASASFDPDGVITNWAIDLQNDGTYDKTFTGQPTTWQFENIWNGPTKIRLGVSDNMGSHRSAVITVNASKGWYVKTIDPIGWAGLWNSLAICNGQPAIAYYQFYSRELKYVSATDTYGYNPWATPISLGAIAPPGTSLGYGHCSLAWVEGAYPAIAVNGQFPFYALAKNSQGTSWHPYQSSSGGKIGIAYQPDLKVVNLKPAIVYRDYLAGAAYVRAKDFQGTTWENPQILDADGWNPVIGIVGGNPAVVFSKEIKVSEKLVGALHYKRATNANGTAWGPTVVIDSTSTGMDPAIAIINGRPAVAYVADSSSKNYGFEVRYERANDALGSTWNDIPVTVKLDGRAVLGLEEIDGRPAIGLSTCMQHDVWYFRANDSKGLTWPNGIIVDNMKKLSSAQIMTVPDGDMIEINDRPAMSYYYPGKGDLKYAVLE